MCICACCVCVYIGDTHKYTHALGIICNTRCYLTTVIGRKYTRKKTEHIKSLKVQTKKLI